MQNKIVVEKVCIDQSFLPEPELIDTPKISALLDLDWTIKHLFQQEWGVNGIKNPTHLVITAVLEKTE